MPFFIRMAVEPLFKDHGAPQTEYRTHERWVQLYMEQGKYHVESGNDRGTMHNDEFEDIAVANARFDELKTACGMNEDSWKEVQAENKKLTLEELIKCYFEAGDNLIDMDDWLEKLKADAHVRYTYKNLYTNNVGFLARAIIWRPHERVEVYIENDGLGHFVKNIRAL